MQPGGRRGGGRGDLRGGPNRRRPQDRGPVSPRAHTGLAQAVAGHPGGYRGLLPLRRHACKEYRGAGAGADTREALKRQGRGPDHIRTVVGLATVPLARPRSCPPKVIIGRKGIRRGLSIRTAHSLHHARTTDGSAMPFHSRPPSGLAVILLATFQLLILMAPPAESGFSASPASAPFSRTENLPASWIRIRMGTSARSRSSLLGGIRRRGSIDPSSGSTCPQSRSMPM